MKTDNTQIIQILSKYRLNYSQHYGVVCSEGWILNGREHSKHCNLHKFKELCQSSNNLGYNWSINFSKFKKIYKEEFDKGTNGYWNNMNTEVMLFPLYIHHHKHGVECEAHMRCQVYISKKRGYAFFDVSLPLYDRLETISEDVLKQAKKYHAEQEQLKAS